MEEKYIAAIDLGTERLRQKEYVTVMYSILKKHRSLSKMPLAKRRMNLKSRYSKR